MAGPQVQTAESEDEFASVNSILLSSSLLVLIAIGYRINTHRLRHVPESGAAMALGFVLGIVVRVVGIVEEEQLLNFKGSLFFYVLLPPIIFEAGMSLETQMFVDNVGAIFAFAVVGTLISTWVTSWGLRMMAGIGGIGLDSSAPRLAIHCHLFGALISATDPVATISLFSGARFRADPLLHSLLNGESVLNDAVAIALFTTLTRHLDEENPSLFSFAVLSNFLFVSTASLILGLLAGGLCSWCFKRTKLLSNFPEYEISAMFLGAYLTFASSQLLGLSGIVALFFFGVVLAQYNYYNLSDRSKVASQVCFGTLAKLAEACVFVYLGVVAALSVGRFHWHLGLVLFTGVVITVARAAHIFPLTAVLNVWRYRKIGQNVAVSMWISGLRGAIAFALSLRLPCASGTLVRHGTEECRNTDLLVTTTISIVMVTTLVVGSSMEHVMTALHVIEHLPPGGADRASPRAHSSRGSPHNGLSQADSSSALEGPRSRGQYCSSDIVGISGDAAGGEALRLPRVGMVPDDSDPEATWRRLGDDWEASGGDALLEGGGRPGGGARTLRKARGWIYQAFARFDMDHIQPALGGPSFSRLQAEADRGDGAMEMPSLQGILASGIGAAAAESPPRCPTEEDSPPTWSRSAIFE